MSVRRTNSPIAGPEKARVPGPSTNSTHPINLSVRRGMPRARSRRCPRAARLQHRGHAGPSGPKIATKVTPPAHAASLSRSSWMARRQRPQGSQKHLAPAAAAACAGAQPARKYLEVHAGELAVEPHLQILRRNRRSLLLRLEYAHRSTVENHVHRSPRLGSRRSLIVRVGISPSHFVRDRDSYWHTSHMYRTALRQRSPQGCVPPWIEHGRADPAGSAARRLSTTG